MSSFVVLLADCNQPECNNGLSGKYKLLDSIFLISTNLLTGVYIHLRGKNYTNNSVISISEVGVGEDALLCITDMECFCHNHTGGEFYYPNNTKVPGPEERGRNFIYYDKKHKMIRLNRKPEMNLTGKYRCEIPDSRGLVQKLYFTLQPIACQ